MLVTNTFLFEKEVTRLNKKAVKIGVPLITFKQLGKKTVFRTTVCVDQDGNVSEDRMPIEAMEYQVTVPQIEDRRWTLLASVTATEGDKHRCFVESHIKGFDPTPYQDNDPCKCDHCHSKRHRNQTYLVQNKDTQKVLQLGRNCFVDYVGNDHLAKLEFQSLVCLTFGDNDEEFMFPGGSGKLQVVDVRQTVAIAECIAEVTGWKNNVYDQFSGEVVLEGTHRQAAGLMKRKSFPVLAAMERIEKYNKDENDPIRAKVESAIERIQGMEFGPDEDFGRALAQCAEFQMIPARKASLVAYLCEFLRNTDRKAVLEAKKATMVHVGTVGKREDFTLLVCRKVVSFEGAYGTVRIHILEDSKGNELIWKTTSAEIAQDEIVSLKATVKEHGERNGAKQTILTRCKIIDQSAKV